MYYYRLSEKDYDLAVDIGTRRYTNNREAGVVDRRRDVKMDDLGPDHWGMMGEIAFARVFGLEPDLTIEPRIGTPDYVIDGITIDVKATPLPQGRLLATPVKKRENIDLYVLTIPRGRAVKFPGYVTHDRMFRTLTDLGHGPTYAVPQEDLQPFEKLMELLRVGTPA